MLFERDDFAQIAGDQWEESLWLCGVQLKSVGPFIKNNRGQTL